MPTDPDLSAHIRDALRAGRSRDELRGELAEAGWTTPEIEAALAGWMARDGAAPVPRPVRSSAARDALFYALLFVVFAMVAGNTLALLFRQIDLLLPEPGDSQFIPPLTAMRWAMASLLVFLPVLLLLDRTDQRAARRDPSRKHGLMRRWLSAIALLLAALTLLGDALYVIFTWLDGQITARFLVKSVTVAVMAALVLAYFREDRSLPLPRLPVRAIWPFAGVSALALALAFGTVGGPAQGQREARDAWKVEDMRTLMRDMRDCAALDEDDLPESFDPMACAKNPEWLTGFAGSITYERLSQERFRLCSTVEAPERLRGWSLEVEGDRVCIANESV